jgi:phospholipid transport system substrate-binding protein
MQRYSRLSLAALFTLTLATLGAVLPTRAAAQVPPDELVKRVADDVLSIVRQEPDLAGNATRVAQLIEEKVAPHFDFERITRLAVGRSWRDATPEQRKQLVEEFRKMLIRSYSAAYTTYRHIVIEVKPLKMQPGEDDVQVNTVIKLPGGAPPIDVGYSMFKASPDWKVYDVSVGGVSLVTTYRSSFAEQIRQGGIDGLIKSLADINAGAIPPKPVGTAKKN